MIVALVLLSITGCTVAWWGHSLAATRVSNTVFTEMRFWLLVGISFVLPFVIYGVLLKKHAISVATVLVFGFTLVLIAGVDVYLLKSLATLAKHTPSLADDAVFVSEISLALYLLPALYGGIGINIISHILMRHLVEAERKFLEEHPDA